MIPQASIIIPNWNGKDLLFDCLNSLQKQTFKDFEIIVVDNGSSDKSVELIKKNWPKIKIVELDKNYGFANAINQGVQNSSSKYVVLLNNDTSVDKNWLQELVKTADKHKEVISVGSKLLNFYDHKIIDGVGIDLNEVGQGISLGWKQKDEGQFEKEIYIFGATGGAALFKKEEFIKLEMFDEHYFMYFEEVDFAFRAQFAGYKSIYCPSAIVFHKHKATSGKNLAKVEYWQFKNMTQNIIKNMPTSLLLKRWRWLKILLVHLNTYVYQIKNGYFWTPFVADLWILINLPRLILARMKIQQTKKVSDSYIEGFLSEKKITFWGIKK